MRLLRIVLFIYAAICLLGAASLLFKGGVSILLGIYLLINSVVIIAGIFLEKRYKPEKTSESGWQKTKEKFVDEKTGRTMEVEYNPKTGERNYVESNKDK